jgi:hypothetical protein
MPVSNPNSEDGLAFHMSCDINFNLHKKDSLSKERVNIHGIYIFLSTTPDIANLS